jgi:ATP-dependent RNA helicase DDX10/DBP4
LFSATQTRSVKDLARLSLKDPEVLVLALLYTSSSNNRCGPQFTSFYSLLHTAQYVSVHEAAETTTPKELTQHYTIVPLPDKIKVRLTSRLFRSQLDYSFSLTCSIVTGSTRES